MQSAWWLKIRRAQLPQSHPSTRTLDYCELRTRTEELGDKQDLNNFRGQVVPKMSISF